MNVHCQMLEYFHEMLLEKKKKKRDQQSNQITALTREGQQYLHPKEANNEAD